MLYVLLPLLADADPISGGAGWVGAGLLGMVLGWLLIIHLPAKDKQLQTLARRQGRTAAQHPSAEGNALVREAFLKIKEMGEAKDKQIEAMLTRKWEIIQALTRDYKDGLKEVSAHCEQEISRLTEYWQSQMGSLTHAIEDLAEKITVIPRSGP
jgi:gas vesicle protein